MLFALVAVLSGSLLEVPPSQWKAIDLTVSDHGTTVDCSFEVTRGSRVQVMLTDRTQAQRFVRGRSFQPLYTTGFEKDAHFRFRIREAGEYVLLVDNRIDGREAAQVTLNLDLRPTKRVDVQEVPPARRHLVIALSLLFFGSVLVFTAVSFLRHA